MLQFEGDRRFSLPPSELWNRLTDTRFLLGCIPDVETVHDLQPDRARLTIRPGFAFVRGSLEVSLQVVPQQSPTLVQILLSSKGIGSSSEVEAQLQLTPSEESEESATTTTTVHWTMVVKSLGGLLKLVPGGLIRGAAQQVVEQAWNKVEENIKTL